MHIDILSKSDMQPSVDNFMKVLLSGATGSELEVAAAWLRTAYRVSSSKNIDFFEVAKDITKAHVEAQFGVSG